MMNIEKITIPKLLETRMAMGITRAELVSMSKVSYTTLYYLEKGEPVKPSTAGKIAKALGKKIEELQ